MNPTLIEFADAIFRLCVLRFGMLFLTDAAGEFRRAGRRIDRAFDHGLVGLFEHSAISDAKEFAMGIIASLAGQKGSKSY